MKNIIQHIILLVDASGSMGPFVKETRKSISSIIKKLPQNAHLTLVFFDTNAYNIVANNWVSNIPRELAYLYRACGGTPITDSVYKAIQDITRDVKNIACLNDKHKFIIFTDGEENSSTHATEQDLGRAIEHFTNNFDWDFQFIGPKSQEEGIKKYTDSIKIKRENVALYASVSDGLKTMVRMAVNQ